MDYKKEIDIILNEDIDNFSKKIKIIAVLTSAIKENLNLTPVVVGGQAVEFYTGGGYATMDVDMVCETSTKKIGEILEKLGFYRDNKYWILDSNKLDLAVETPSGPLAGADDKLMELEIGQHTAYFIGIEDIIIDRLNAYVHWNEKWQEEWILGMMVTNYEDIDWEYLNKKAYQERVNDSLKRMVDKTEKIIKFM
ncbi:DUF6036 family nucleotidyltransferase [Halanaerobium congolense]|jgi:hypothetical protein|uniref:DUF6036 domain-containing protein n=1 Tax=Halanaerobium congolense TaxID=54121 RepID=A0A1G6MFX3_9FIRM|nr:DUF6036 family nucleotidyltransferase [Halanaerobium congolense]KXS49578.1 MAG: hypothetical protein AWL62_908 [Halanaerobium sp. T82-1]OEG63260.1 MAG: hypothetical protein BHK79_05695 [Halanaerobium sp. MDAL1]PUU93597.1 MAG: hypothetical protein CI948_39 [Halanaerobium sp.]PTX17288.1 hypothetical protein C7953_2060 [Halanaerobium congolense]TDP25620.1 hypothetical protein C8C79_10640 [Halanaerobium congolense]